MKSFIQICSVLVALLLAALSGCASYYRVTDPSTSKVYYAKEIKKLSGGAVRIKDEKAGDEVTLQNSEIKKIEKEEFNQGVYSK